MVLLTVPLGQFPSISEIQRRQPLVASTSFLYNGLSEGQGTSQLMLGIWLGKRTKWHVNAAVSVPTQTKICEVDKFCYALGGKKPIHSILVANNGMAAVKFICSIRTWAYETFGTEKAILLVAMATPEDLRINAEHIKIADRFIEVPGGTNNNNYANVQLIIEIAEMAGVDAVWPGWGHASENPELPDALNSRGIVFLGPSGKSMGALGDKVGSSLIAQAADVPTLPWSGSHVKVSQDNCLLDIPNEIYEEACVHSTEEALASCQAVGYPAMIKASWGGGGKGIRKVNNDDEVRALFKQVQGEVPGSPIFIMRVASQCRHLEVQLLCDQYGNVAALHSRDCSVQRRHQKIIEEGPITVASLETVGELEQAARRLAKSVSYVGAATVEYLYSVDTGEYYFLELNPRLQVEHPVTEWIAEVNLPAAQVAVGMGIPLWQIPEIRRFYGVEHGGGWDAWRAISALATPFDFDKAVSRTPKGHCIAVRVTSEDPEDAFRPTSGTVQELSFKSKPNVWAYFSVKSGGGIHEFSDSQFGHFFAFGESRCLAIANMVLGLKEIQIRGEIHTNVDYTIDLLHAPDYQDNKIHTGWLDDRIALRVKTERPPWYLAVAGGALFRASASNEALISDFVSYLEKGQIPPKHISLVNSQVTLNVDEVKYTIDIVRGGPGSYRLMINGSEMEAEIFALQDGGLLMQVAGNSHVIYAEEETAGTRLLVDGKTVLLQNDHDPSNLVAETPCKLTRYLVSDGSHVDADCPYAEVEVMKMCMPLVSPAAGVIHFKMLEGQVMQSGQLVARLDLDDPSAVQKAEPFEGTFPMLGPSSPALGKVHQRCVASINAARMILAGYDHDVDEVVNNLIHSLDSPELPFLQWQECLAALTTRLPKDLRTELEAKCLQFQATLNFNFPSKQLRSVLDAHLSSCPENEKGAQERLVEPLMNLVKNFECGRESHARIIARSLFDQYLLVENLFTSHHQDDVVEQLRVQYKEDLRKVVDIVLSHQGIKRKNRLILRLMEQLVFPNPDAYTDKLLCFSKLDHLNYSKLARKACQLLEKTKLNEVRSSIARNLSELDMFTEDGENGKNPKKKSAIDERVEDIVNSSSAVEDALVGLFDHHDPFLQRRVLETYVRRLYGPLLVKGSFEIQRKKSGLVATWEFVEERSERRNAVRPVVGKQRERNQGTMVVVKSLQNLPEIINAALNNCALGRFQEPRPSHTVHVGLVGSRKPRNLTQDSGDEGHDQWSIKKVGGVVKEQKLSSVLSGANVGVISCVIQRDEGRVPLRHSWHWLAKNMSYKDVPSLRHVEHPLSIFLELNKLEEYEHIQYAASGNGQWHMYSVTDKSVPWQRMFLRTLVRQPTSKKVPMSETSKSILSSLVTAMEELELNLHGSTTIIPDHAHVYLCVLREQQLDGLIVGQKEIHEETEAILEGMAEEIHSSIGVRMHELGVCEWEVKLRIAASPQTSDAWRVMVTNVTGHTCTVQVYRELEDCKTHRTVFQSVSSHGPLHGVPVMAPYQPLGDLFHKRLLARRSSTTYCYDFVLTFEKALKQIWESQEMEKRNPGGTRLLEASELVLADDNGSWGGPLVPVDRPAGVNDIGMVAWKMKMLTPEFPYGRSILVIANDVTFRAGSLGPKEDAFFLAVANLACASKLPLIYLAANSGARIGVADEIKSCFKVGWSDEGRPEHGFQYLYLTPEDKAEMGSYVISHELRLAGGEARWVIDAIVGKEDGLGVENLSGSAGIASAYSRAYEETFTLTFVTGRTVGIGAYLSRLGMRCIQRLDQPIILTGFSALNKLLGREVYSSQMQLGGPKVMAANGVVHLTVADDLQGASAILNWLSLVSAQTGGDLPISAPLDSPRRPVEYLPVSACDPRAAIRGTLGRDGKWLGGIFDKGSFVETLDGWAKTVVTGRARLGGIPVGLIAVETQTVMQVSPADPGRLDSQERVVPQAGQVWFPDSATKTAQAILDFGREGLPLFILANWRGFSGGQKDLFEGILQAGSAIVENLRTYRQPVFVYIPMMGELRGGAWAVLDRQINSDFIEMYADGTAKGNVLEPEGMIEVKFRAKELVKCMGRLDLQLIDLKARLQEARRRAAGEMVESVEREMKARERQLLPLYTQIATKFADLHDASSRMAAKGVIREVVNWRESRSFFYKRLCRRIAEICLIKSVKDAAGDRLSHEAALNLIKIWFCDSGIAQGRQDSWEDDDAFFQWKDNSANYDERLDELRVQNALHLLSNLSDSISNLKPLPQCVAAILSKVEPATRQQLIDEILKLAY